MKKKQIQKLMDNKITIFVCSIFACLIMLISIGSSYSYFTKTLLDLNGNGDTEVGDVVILRKYIINDYNKYKVTIEGANIDFLSDTSDTVVEGTTLKAYVYPNAGYFVASISCTNDQTAGYSNYTVSVFNVTKDTTCTITTDKKAIIADYIISKVGSTTNGGLKNISQAANTYFDASTDYRYYGSNPNNYVIFNGELWRIVGLFNVQTPGTDSTYTKEMRVKLVRNESIGTYSWDTSAASVNSGHGINEWSQSDLMKLLNSGYDSNQDVDKTGTTVTVNNSLYYNKLSGTCYSGNENTTSNCDFTSSGLNSDAKELIDKAKYYLGGWTTSSLTASDFYLKERGTTVVASPADGVTRTTSWDGMVGVIYPSDFGYAVDESLCPSANLGSFTSEDCLNNDWLFTKDYKATITPVSSDTSYFMGVLPFGSIVSMTFPSNAFAIYPTVYLKNQINVVGGNGTKDFPYLLKLNA